MPPRKGYQPKYVGGRPNRFFTGNDPQSASKILKEDLINIASDFDVSTRKAARALYRGEEEEYKKQLEKSSAIYAAYEKYQYLTEDLEKQEELSEEWINNYMSFRELNHLNEKNYDEVRYENLDMNEVTRQYKETYNDMHVQEAIAHAEIELNNIVDVLGHPKPRQEYVNSYKEKIRNNTSPSSKKETKTSDNFETKEMPVVNPYDNNDNKIYYGKPMSNNRKNKKKHKVNDSNNSSRKSQGFVSDMEDRLGVSDNGSFVPNIRKKVGPLRFNIGRRGLSSVVVDMGPVNFMAWSRDYSPGVSSIKMPVGYYRPKRKKKNKNSNRIRNKDFLDDYDTSQNDNNNFLIRGLKNFFRT